MNPTVSLKSTSLPCGSPTRRVVGSSVANSLSSASTPAPHIRLSRLDLPALVYPTKEITGMSFFLRRSRYCRRCARTCSRSFLRSRIWFLRRRLSISICFSPMPLTMPPACRSRCVHIRVSRGSWYSACASSTCSLPSLVAARCEKMSRMRAVRSATCTSSPHTSERFRSCPGLSSSSKMTVSTRRFLMSMDTSSTLPLPMYVRGCGDSRA
mmetsp:Transcript_32034/g.102013  ORF Transcript_32034/g.102013 Transcript_32034/m.102013 type:complete len:211 (+) Transcript_32034:540-1172(+)